VGLVEHESPLPIISSRADPASDASKCPSSSKVLMNWEMVRGVPASGAGASYWPQRALRELEIAWVWEADWERLAFMV